ncbi:UNVERIFIED_CONTAM: hypothetical protein ODW78_00750, partial [Salmonella enterica subsp. enterica serovar Enteritidis]
RQPRALVGAGVCRNRWTGLAVVGIVAGGQPTPSRREPPLEDADDGSAAARDRDPIVALEDAD